VAVVRGAVLVRAALEVLTEGEPAERDGVAPELAPDGAGAAPDGPESPPPSATTPTTSNTTPTSATSAPTNRAPPGAARADRSRSTGGLPPGGFDTCVVPDVAKVPSSGRSPELPVRSSNV
jgi:hypothetical protein